MSLNKSNKFDMILSFDGFTLIIMLLSLADSLYDTIVSYSYMKLDSCAFSVYSGAVKMNPSMSNFIKVPNDSSNCNLFTLIDSANSV